MGIRNLYEYCLENPEMDYLLMEWDYTKNIKTPNDYSIGSGIKVNWICRKCGFPWSAEIGKRVGRKKGAEVIEKPRGCPVCAGRTVWLGHNDLKTLAPEVADEWDYDRNYPHRPEEYTVGCNSSFYWICSKDHNHKWPAIIANRTKGSGCPFCANKIRGDKLRKKSISNGNILSKKFPLISEEWDYSKNQTTPDDYPPYSNKKVAWKCKKCDHGWNDSIANRTRNCRGCPKCKRYYHTSVAEQIVFYAIKKKFADAVNGYKDKIINPYSLDIYIPSINLGIEYDGEPWHQVPEKDINKTVFLHKKGLRIIRIREKGCPDLETNINIINTGKTNYSSYKYLEPVLKKLFTYISSLIGYTINLHIDIPYIRDQVIQKKNSEVLEYSFEDARPEKSKEWNYKKNGKLKPNMFPPQSNTEVWWSCSKCGFEYPMLISNRYWGQGCPVCAGKQLWKGHNDFKSQCPDLMKEWNYDKNKGIEPDELKLGDCKTQVWWRCIKCQHEWHACIYSRTTLHTGCPKCAGKIIGEKVAKKLSIKVICVTTGEHFNSITEAAKFYQIHKSSISNCCKGKQQSAGKTKDGKKLVWEFDNSNKSKSISDSINKSVN